MPALKFDKFGGQIPAVDERLLPMTNAAYTENAYLQSGRLEPLSADVDIFTANPNTRYAFRIPISSPGIDSMKDSYWLEFEDVDTTVIRSPVSNTSDGGRFYWASSSGPPGYTTRQRVSGGDPPLLLGIPTPTVAPVVVPSDIVTAPLVTRAYVYTWLSSLGEESQPSPPDIETGYPEASWSVTVTFPTIEQGAGRDLTKLRIYRTESDAEGNAAFFYVDEIPIPLPLTTPAGTTVYVDTVSADFVANSEQLLSTDWSPPPADLQGLVSMPNGMVVGWRANELWFCEPYRPHAWPVKYTINVDAPIVGLGTIDQNCMVLTAGQPWVAMGIHPEVMALRKVQPLEPCTAQGSIVNTPNGVLYTSNNGLILIGPSGGKNLTFDIIRKDEWPDIINLATVHATYFMNGYYCYSAAIEGVFQADAFQVSDEVPTPGDEAAFQADNFKGTRVGAHINLSDERLGLMTLTCEQTTRNVMLDIWTGETLVLRDGGDGTIRVYHVDRRESAPRQSYKWLSKIVELSFDQNLAAVKVNYIPPRGAPPTQTLFKYYAPSGKLRYTRPVTRSGERFRLPSGFKADEVQFELDGDLMITSLEVASSMRELRKV